jgi:hypothetical protein
VYRRADFEDLWRRYLPSETSKRPNPDEMGTSDTFSSVRAEPSGRIENSKLSYGNGDLDAWTDRKPEKGEVVQHRPNPVGETTASGGHKCTQCGKDGDVLKFYSGSPTPVWLHWACATGWQAANGSAPQ